MSSLSFISPIHTTTPLSDGPASEDEQSERNIHLKFALIGSAQSGKTCIVDRLLRNQFDAAYRATESPTCHDARPIILDDIETNQKYVIQLQLWDTAGSLQTTQPKQNIIPACHRVNKLEQPNPFDCFHSEPPIRFNEGKTSDINTSKTDAAEATTPANNRTLPLHATPSQNVLCEASTPSLHCLPHNPHDSPDLDIDLDCYFADFDSKQALRDLPLPPNTRRHTDLKQLAMSAQSGTHEYANYSSDDSSDSASRSSDASSDSFDITQAPMCATLDALILVYDVTNKHSLQHLARCLEAFTAAQRISAEDEVPVLVLGNKLDKDGRQVSYKEGRSFSRQLDNPYKLFREVSAKTGHGLEGCMTELARSCIDRDYQILQLVSADSLSSNESYRRCAESVEPGDASGDRCSDRGHVMVGREPTKRYRKRHHRLANACSSGLCSKQNDDLEDPPFCVVL